MSPARGYLVSLHTWPQRWYQWPGGDWLA